MHFAVLTITPERPDEAALEELLWPWCLHNEDATLPMWDYMDIGGCFEGLLDPTWTPTGADRDWTVVPEHAFKQKRHLNVAALQDRAATQASELYDRVQAAMAGLSLPDLAKLRDGTDALSWLPLWHSDPAVQAVRSVTGPLPPEAVMGYAAPRAVAIARAKRHALLTSAIVRDGVWHDSNLRSWEEDVAGTEAWAAEAEGLIAEAAPDDWLTVVDCHA